MCLFTLEYFLIEVNTFDRIFFYKRRIFIKLSSHTSADGLILCRGLLTITVKYYSLLSVKYLKIQKKKNHLEVSLKYSIIHVTCLKKTKTERKLLGDTINSSFSYIINLYE